MLSRIAWGIFGSMMSIGVFSILYLVWKIVVDVIKAVMNMQPPLEINFPFLIVVIVIGIIGFTFMFNVMKGD